jgi:hypothetical protein
MPANSSPEAATLVASSTTGTFCQRSKRVGKRCRVAKKTNKGCTPKGLPTMPDIKTFPLNYCMGNKNSATRMPPPKPPKKSAITTAPIKAPSTRIIAVTLTQSPIGHA